jgi:hypothetical protein
VNSTRSQLKRIDRLRVAYSTLWGGRTPEHAYMHRDVYDQLRAECPWTEPDDQLTMIYGMEIHVFDGSQHATTLELSHERLPLWRFGA